LLVCALLPNVITDGFGVAMLAYRSDKVTI